MLQSANNSEILLEGVGSPEGVKSAGLDTYYKDTATGDIYIKATRSGATGWKNLGSGTAVGGGLYSGTADS